MIISAGKLPILGFEQRFTTSAWMNHISTLWEVSLNVSKKLIICFIFFFFQSVIQSAPSLPTACCPTPEIPLIFIRRAKRHHLAHVVRWGLMHAFKKSLDSWVSSHWSFCIPRCTRNKCNTGHFVVHYRSITWTLGCTWLLASGCT